MVSVKIDLKKKDLRWIVPLVLVLVIGFGVAVVDPNIHGHPDAAGGVPAGTVSAFNLASCPSGWVLADGSAGTPDLRGQFIRGLDMGAGVDPGRTLNSPQDDELESHRHTSYAVPNTGNCGSNIGGGDTDNCGTKYGGYFGGTETRPTNVALIYCVSVGTGSADVGSGFAPIAYAGEETIIYPNGMIMKTGTGSGSQATHTIDFEVDFLNGVSSVVLTPLINSDTPHSYPMHVKSKSVSGFVYRQPNGGGGYTSVDWVAWGY